MSNCDPNWMHCELLFAHSSRSLIARMEEYRLNDFRSQIGTLWQKLEPAVGSMTACLVICLQEVCALIVVLRSTILGRRINKA